MEAVLVSKSFMEVVYVSRETLVREQEPQRNTYRHYSDYRLTLFKKPFVSQTQSTHAKEPVVIEE